MSPGSGTNGYAIVYNHTSGKFELVVGIKAILIATLFSGAVGVFFGFYPARRASKLQPVECLRYE